MYVKTKLVKTGNSLSIRLSKEALQLTGFKPGQELALEVRPDRIVIRHPNQIEDHRLDQAYRDSKAVWDQALKDAWEEIFGADEDE